MIRNVIFKLLKNHTIITYFNFLPIILLPHTIIINTLQFSISNLLSIHDNPTTYSRNPNSNPPSSNFSSHRKRRRKKKHRRTKKEERKNNGGTKTGNGKVGSRYHDACWCIRKRGGQKWKDETRRAVALTEVTCRSGASGGWASRFRGFFPRDKGCEEIGRRNNSITSGQG